MSANERTWKPLQYESFISVHLRSLIKMSCFNLVAYISQVKTDFDFSIKLWFMRLLKCQHDSALYKEYCTLYKYHKYNFKKWDPWRKYFPWYLNFFIWNGQGKIFSLNLLWHFVMLYQTTKLWTTKLLRVLNYEICFPLFE